MISYADIPQNIIDGLRSALNAQRNWDHRDNQDTKNALVTFLINAQGARCAYCRRLIRDELGHREIDHVLPKGASGKKVNAVSNLKKHRRSTLGYLSFRFEPENLVLTCKRCNHRKGNYDCRADRSRPVGNAYPHISTDFEWIHPFHHEYSDHINIFNNFIYQEVPDSNGLAVINACALADIDAIEARAREQWVAQMKDPAKMALQLYIRDEPEQRIIDSVTHRFPHITAARVRSYLKLVIDNRLQ